MSENIFKIKDEPPDDTQIKEIINDKYFMLDAIRQFTRENIGETKKSLNEARKYAEGRGISFEVYDNKHLDDIQKLIEIKVG